MRAREFAMGKGLAAALLLLWSMAFSAAVAAAETPRLLVLPFEFSGQQPLDYLRQALPDLLASRIGQSREVVVVQADAPADVLAGKPAFSAALARELGRAQRTDYVLSGRFTEIGNRFSIDAALFDVRSGELLERYSAEGADMSQLIPKLGELGQSVRERFSALARAAPRASAPAAAPQAATASAQKGSVSKVWFSPPLAMEIRGIGVGEVRERGRNDIVLVTRKEVYVYRRHAEELELLARYSADRSVENIGVDVADLNGDGLAEIYVTATAPGQALASYVMRWNGSALQPIAAGLPWHLRLAQLPDGPALLGQRRGSEKFFDGPIRRLAWRDGKLVAGEALKLPGHVTLYSFVMADVNGDGRPEVVSLQSRSPLMVYDLQGRILRRGANYGQTALYVVEKRERNDAPAEESQLPGRLRAVELPRRGLSLLAAQNHESTSVFYRARTFTGGEVVALRLENDGLVEVWRTKRLAYVADFQVSVLQPGGEPMVVIATVSDFEGLVGAPRSFIVVTPLEQ